MILDLKTIDTIQGSAAVIIAKEFAEWINGEPVERTFQKAFDDIYSEIGLQARVIIVAIKIFMNDYEENEQTTINISMEY